MVLPRETRCHRRRQRHVQSEGGAVFGELFEVAAFKRVAAGEHHAGARFVIARDGVQEPLAQFRGLNAVRSYESEVLETSIVAKIRR